MNNYPMPEPGMNGLPNNQLMPQQQPPNLPPQQPQQPHQPITGLGIAALVLGIIALLTSFIPIVNNLSFILALIGLVLGTIGRITCTRGMKSGKGIAIAGIILCALSLVVVIGVQGSFSKAFNEGLSSTSKSSVTASSSAAASSGSSATVSASDASVTAKYAVSIDDCTLGRDYQDRSIAIVSFSFTNNSDGDANFMTSTVARAFQNGVELDSAFGGEVDSDAIWKNIKPGTTIAVQEGYVLADMSPMTVEVDKLINFGDDLLAEKTFAFE